MNVYILFKSIGTGDLNATTFGASIGRVSAISAVKTLVVFKEGGVVRKFSKVTLTVRRGLIYCLRMQAIVEQKAKMSKLVTKPHPWQYTPHIKSLDILNVMGTSPFFMYN